MKSNRQPRSDSKLIKKRVKRNWVDAGYSGQEQVEVMGYPRQKVTRDFSSEKH